MKDNLLVFTIILIASLLFFSGCTDSKTGNTDLGNSHIKIPPGVMVLSDTGRIRIVLVTGGDDIPSYGYSLKDSVTIKLNDTTLSDDNLTGNIGWEEDESLFIGSSPPILDDEISKVDMLEPGYYNVTVFILETVVCDKEILVI
jgi:hypothetical protein